jgi:hypothetical protein
VCKTTTGCHPKVELGLKSVDGRKRDRQTGLEGQSWSGRGRRWRREFDDGRGCALHYCEIVTEERTLRVACFRFLILL